jgi:hypothetical protein
MTGRLSPDAVLIAGATVLAFVLNYALSAMGSQPRPFPVWLLVPGFAWVIRGGAQRRR